MTRPLLYAEVAWEFETELKLCWKLFSVPLDWSLQSAKNSRYQQLEGATCCFTCWLDHPISKHGHCRTCMILLFRIPLYLHTQGAIQSGEVNALAEHMEGQSVSWWPPCSMLFKARRWCLRARETTERQRRDNRELLRLYKILKLSKVRK